MSGREKIIVVLTCLVVAWGGYNLLFSNKSQQSGRSATSATVSEVSDFVASISASLQKTAEARPTDAPYIIARASADWTADPFLNRQQIVAFNAEKSKEEEKPEIRPADLGLAYTGYLAAGNNILAVINGLEYQVGEKLEKDGNYIVKSISPAQVVIGRDGSASKIIIPLEETDF